MKQKQNSNNNQNNEEDNFNFFYEKVKKDYDVQEGGNKALIITASVLGGLALVGYIIYRVLKKKPAEIQALAQHLIEIETNMEALKDTIKNTNIGHKKALEYTIIPPPDCENNNCEKVEEKYNGVKVALKIDKDIEEHKIKSEEEAEKKKKEDEKKKKEDEKKKKDLKGGNPNDGKELISSKKQELLTACKDTEAWNKLDKEFENGPVTTNKQLNQVIDYILLEGAVTKVMFQEITKNTSGKINKKKIFQAIRDLVQEHFKKYKECDFNKVKGEFNINTVLTDEDLSKLIQLSLQKIRNTINNFNVSKIYDLIGIKETDKNVCQSLPISTLLGIPRLTHKTLKSLENTLNRKKLTRTGKLIGDTENKLCVLLLDAVLNDLVTPIKDKMLKQIDKLIKTFNETDNKGGALIGEGVYGCVFRPHLYCNGKESTGKKDHVSKLIIGKKWKIEREYTISNLIKTINNYDKFFAPLLEICPVDLKKIYTQGKEDCKLLNKKQDSSKVSYLAKMKYIPMKDFNDFITEQDNLNNFVNFVSVFPNILDTIDMLIKKKIVHYDLHGGNIIINKETNKPVVIDFGLSFSIKKFNIRDLEANFGIFNNAPSWSNYSIEIHYLSFIVNNKRHMNIGEANQFINKYIEKHRILNSFPGIITYDEKNNFKKKLLLAINSFKRQNINSCIKFIIKKCWKTWDTHMLSYLYLNYFKIFNINNLLLNKFCKKTILLLFNNISPLSEERLHPIKLKNKLIRNLDYLSPQILLKIKTNYDENQEYIYNTFKKETFESFKNRILIENKY